MSLDRVVFPLLSFNRSGGVRSALAVANGLAQNNIQVRIYVPGYDAVPPEEVQRSVEILRLPVGGTAPRIRYIWRLVRKLSEENALFVSTGYQTPAYIHLAQVLAGRRNPVVSLVQSYEPLTHIRYGEQPVLLKPLLHLIAHAGYWLPGHKIAVSRFVADRVGMSYNDSVIFPGISGEYAALLDPERSGSAFPAAASTGKKVVGFFPSRARVKGIRFALEAFERLGGGESEFEFLAYNGDLADYGLPDYVQRFSRRGNSIVDFYRCCDVFLFPSLAEGFGLPPLEAMACGTPVILTDCGGVDAYAADHVNCLKIPPADSTAIAAAIKRITGDPGLARRLAAGGQKTAALYTRERFVRECVQEISRLL